MLNRRTLILGAASAGVASPLRAAEPVEILSADVRPLSIAEGPRRGIVLDIVRDALKQAGCDVRFTFLPFAEALEKTQARAGALIAPLARAPQREASFTWIAKVIDVPQAMGTRREKPTADLAAARSLSRVGVVRSGVQQSYLQANGFSNLETFASAGEAARALADGRIDAWYATATEIVLQFESIGRAGEVHIGPAIQSVPVWLAGNRDLSSLPVEKIRSAIMELERTGTVERTYRTYVRT